MIKRGVKVEGVRFDIPPQVRRPRLGHAGHSAFHSGHGSPGCAAGGRMEVATDLRLIENTGPGTVPWRLSMERPTYAPSPCISLADRIRRVTAAGERRRNEEQPGWPSLWEVCLAEAAEEERRDTRDEASSSWAAASGFVGDEEADPGWD